MYYFYWKTIWQYSVLGIPKTIPVFHLQEKLLPLCDDIWKNFSKLKFLKYQFQTRCTFSRNVIYKIPDFCFAVSVIRVCTKIKVKYWKLFKIYEKGLHHWKCLSQRKRLNDKFQILVCYNVSIFTVCS